MLHGTMGRQPLACGGKVSSGVGDSVSIETTRRGAIKKKYVNKYNTNVAVHIYIYYFRIHDIFEIVGKECGMKWYPTM